MDRVMQSAAVREHSSGGIPAADLISSEPWLRYAEFEYRTESPIDVRGQSSADRRHHRNRGRGIPRPRRDVISGNRAILPRRPRR